MTIIFTGARGVTLNFQTNIDLSEFPTATAASVSVRRPNGVIDTWGATITDATNGIVQVVTKTTTSDFPIDGRYRMNVLVTSSTNGKRLIGETATIIVRNTYYVK
jgi:hypothetical protein